MPKLFRRSWERMRSGKRGAISAVKSARTGSNGAFSGTMSTPSSQFQASGALFTSGDLNRLIRITGCPNQGRHDGVYIIDSIVDTDNVVLRHNHNIPSTPASLAMFREVGSSLTWKILESATFTVSGDDDLFEDYHSGSNVTIEVATNPNNKGTWSITHRTSSTVVQLSKSYPFYVADYLAAGIVNNGAFFIDHFGDYIAESDMTWFCHDRQPFNSFDLAEIVIQNLIDMGWTMYQARGPSNSMLVHKDVVLKSAGEDNTNISGGKAMFLRITYWGSGRSGTAPLHVFTNSWMEMSLWHHWDPTQTATLPGNGVGGVPFNNSTQYHVPATTNMGASSGSGPYGADIEDPQNGSGRGGLPAGQLFLNYTMFGDRDEFIYYANREGVATTTWHATLSHLRLAGGTNPNVVQITQPFTAGASKNVNVGTVDVAALTPPYAVGDNVTIIGRKTSATAEYIFTTSITAFSNADPNNRIVTLSNADTAMGNGPDTLKVQFGEDPFPVVVHQSSGNTFSPRLHNLSRLANATGRDHNATTFGSLATDFNALSVYTEVDPSRRSGKWGLTAVYVKHTANAELRGRFRYRYRGVPTKFPLYKKLVFVDNTIYVFLGTEGSAADGLYVGPMSKAQANVK